MDTNDRNPQNMSVAFAEAGIESPAKAILKNRFEIAVGRRFPAYDSPEASAYAVNDRRVTGRPLFALVCDRAVPPRIAELKNFAELKSPGVMRPVGWGVVDWPPDRSRRFVIVFERPAGERMVKSLDETFPQLSDNELMRNVVMPLAAVLDECGETEIKHRGIRPTNLFFSQPGFGPAVLGESLTAPPGFHQPARFESIESALCHPAGRGLGDVTDDYFALGTTVLAFALGRRPGGGSADDALLNARLEQGSYAVLAGQESLTPLVRALLRGLLHDDRTVRWGASELNDWLKGRRSQTQHGQAPRESPRTYIFNGERFRTGRPLAHRLARAGASAKPVLADPFFAEWAERVAGSDSMTDVLRRTLAAEQGPQSGARDVDTLLAQLCMALDPPAPLRLRDMATMIDGIGPLLAVGYDDDKLKQDIGDLLLSELPLLATELCCANGTANPQDAAIFRWLRQIMKSKNRALGMEFCLYSLNPALPCRSSSIERYFVVEPAELAPALESLASEPGDKPALIDRHIAAFLSIRFDATLERELNDALIPRHGVLSTLRILARLQAKYGPAELPKLCDWFGLRGKSIVERFQNRVRRQRITAALPAAIRSGNLPQILALLDDMEEARRDAFGFEAASARFAWLTQQELSVTGQRHLPPQEMAARARKLAARCVMGIGLLAILATSIVRGF